MRSDKGEWTLTANRAPLSQLITALSGQPEIRGRVFVDQTGLNGEYSFSFHWTPETSSTENQQTPDSISISLFTAIQDQLGLKIERTRADVDTIVIEHIERPSGN